ncbi:MAG: hypothetical protein HQK96_21410 [Nitrospirae bacterium]|nr:hypothetical protein [Nitrospirota bacterium]
MVEGQYGAGKRESADKRKNIGSYLNYSRFTVFMTVVAVVLLIFTAVSAKGSALKTLHEYALGQLNTFNRYLFDMVKNYQAFPKILAERPFVIEYVRHPNRGADINEYLLKFNDSAGASVVYIINTEGIVTAASNYKTEESLVGKDLRFRECFQNAIKGTPDEYTAIGVYTKTPGYYISYPIRNGKNIIGVVAIKYDLKIFTPHNSGNNEIFMVVDSNGVIFHSSDERYKYYTVQQLPEDVLKKIKDAKQYADNPILPLPIIKRAEKNGLTLVTISQQDKSKANIKSADVEYLEVRTHYKNAQWNVILLIGTSNIAKDIIKNCLYVLLSVFAVYLIGIFVMYRTKSKITLVNSYNDLLEQKKETEMHVKEQEIIKSILNVSLAPDSLELLLQEILELILLNPWISLQAKGCVFLSTGLSGEESGELKIVASQNFSGDQLAACSTLRYGKCLCGLAASTRDIVFSPDSDTDEKHSVKYDCARPLLCAYRFRGQIIGGIQCLLKQRARTKKRG